MVLILQKDSNGSSDKSAQSCDVKSAWTQFPTSAKTIRSKQLRIVFKEITSAE